jgi:hypothetical protein
LVAQIVRGLDLLAQRTFVARREERHLRNLPEVGTGGVDVVSGGFVCFADGARPGSDNEPSASPSR